MPGLPKRAGYFVGIALVVCLAVGCWILARQLLTPDIPQNFEPGRFSQFESWNSEIEMWTLIEEVSSTDLRGRNIFLVNMRSGALLERRLSKSRKLPSHNTGEKWYAVGQSFRNVRELPKGRFTGTVVFREPVNHPLGFVLEPRRIALRYFEDKLIEVNITRSDL